MVKRLLQPERNALRQSRTEARHALIAEVLRLRISGLSFSAAIDDLVRRATDEQAMRKLAIAATSRTDPRGRSPLSRSTLYAWLRRHQQAGSTGLEAKVTRVPDPVPTWLPSFLRTLYPSVEMAYLAWLRSGQSPADPPSLSAVRLALRRSRFHGRIVEETTLKGDLNATEVRPVRLRLVVSDDKSEVP